MGNIFETLFSEAKGNREGKIKKVTVSLLGLKRKLKPKKAQSQGKSREVNDIFRDEDEIMECLISALDIFERSIQTSLVNS